ncbi:hypothetical protein C8J57DRAFT_1537182 [Mycena rebaudengoi]|nr:hypothetical protein C8J57DRAFT_1537182 [Mycena rebaudengoi]
MAPNHKRSTSFALHDLSIQALVRYSCKLRKRTLRSLHSISIFHTLLYDQNCALGTNCNTPAMFVFSCPSTQPHLRAFSAALSGKSPVATVNRELDLDDFWISPPVQVRYIRISPFIFAFCRLIDLAPYGFYYGANDFIPALRCVSSGHLCHPHTCRHTRTSQTFRRPDIPPQRPSERRLVHRNQLSPPSPSLLLYPFTPYSYPDHPLQTPLHRPLLHTRKSYNDGPGLTLHRLHGDAALKSVIHGARELGQGAATPYMSVDVEKVTSGFQTLQELWAAVLTITVACTKGATVMAGSISRFVGAAQKAWHKTTDVWIKLLVRQRAGLGGLYLYRLFMIVNLLNGPLNSIGHQRPEKAEAESDGATRDVADLVDVSIDGNGVKESTVEISLKECTFAWEDKPKSHNILKDITLKLAPRELGRSTGKSSLLMSILEETTLVTGTVKVKAHKIALASQTLFIFPGTLRASEPPVVFPEHTLRLWPVDILLDGAYGEYFSDIWARVTEQ